MSTLLSPTRRVLGNKTTNAILSTQSPKAKVAAPPETRNVPSPRSQKRNQTVNEPILLSSHIGRKRRIEELEGAENEAVQGSQNTTFTMPLSQQTELFGDSLSEREDSILVSTTHSKSTANTTFSSFHASQTDPEPFEAHFEIQEEVSQKTLDKIHAVQIPQPQSQGALFRPNLMKDTSQLSVSMSSLIDFDHSSEGDDGMQMIEEEKSKQTQRQERTEEEMRKDMLLEKAETLRTRLQLALYKVQTNQISKPFARLAKPKARSSSPTLAEPFTSSSPHSSRNRTMRSIDVSHSQEARVAQARSKATMQTKPAVKLLESLPLPRIVPTAFSARWNETLAQEVEEEEAVEEIEQQMPSSPPMSRTSDVHHSNENSREKTSKPRTSRDLDENVPKTPAQLSSPPRSEEGENDRGKNLGVSDNNGVVNAWQQRYKGLTSSVVKGEAASGLLELMAGGRAGNARTQSGGAGMCGL